MWRRDFLLAAGLGLGAYGGIPSIRPLLAADQTVLAGLTFPRDFVWGASTSCYQVEGAVNEDGRAPSIWDVFAHTPGRIADGTDADIACDHYHRSAEDIDWVKRAGFGAYRFSTAWPRILPEGTGALNSKGLDFYDKLVDRLIAAGIAPWLCLYHWDLPQSLQTKGGWLNRDCALWYADYARAVVRRLGDRVTHWAMFNEPSIHAIFGHGFGNHAPGVTGYQNMVAAMYHQTLATGLGLQALRAEKSGLNAGTVLSLQPVHPATNGDQDIKAVGRFDALWNRACLDPLMLGTYPEVLAQGLAPVLRPGDRKQMHQKLDFVGVNYYSRLHVRDDPSSLLLGAGFGAAPDGTSYTAMGWPIEPDGLTEQLLDLRDHYGNPPVYVTENGAAFEDAPNADGIVDDQNRVAYLRAHVAAAQAARKIGANLKGYFVWSLLDNFEWGEGFRRRFGIVRVDFETLKRTPKSSYHWMASLIAAQKGG
jgi:beta-glucosidase